MNRINNKKIKIFKKSLAILLVILVVLSSIKFIFFKPTNVFADSTLGFNEGYGTTVSDNNSNVTGTITNAVWKQEELCKTGKCLYFDGSGDYVSFADSSNLDFGASNSFTLEGWFRTPDISSGQRTIIAKHNATSGGYKVYMDSNGYLIFAIDDDSTWTPDDSVTTSTTAFDDNKWHFFSGVKTETSISIYVDGKIYQTDNSLSATGSLANANSFYIGIDGNGSSNGFSGFLDEIRIIKNAKSASDVITDYTGGSNSISGAAPVGWWKLDENTSTSAYDSSGNENTGTLTNGPTWNTGKFNTSVLFDGTDDTVSITRQSSIQNISNSGTISAWIKPSAVDTNLRTLFDLSSSGVTGVILFSNDPSGLINFQYGTGSSAVSITSSFSPVANTWYHVTATWNSSGGKLYINGSLDNSNSTAPSVTVGAGTSYIGTQGAFPTRSNKGTIDDVRLYDYARSQSQIQEDMQGYPPAGVAASFGPDQSYLSNGLVGYWKMDETSGTTLADYSGNNNTLTANFNSEATGGTITHSGGYTIHTFTSNGTFTPNGNMNVDYLVVGGGGGGSEGGGGGGGVQTGNLAVTAQAYSITVGNGGNGAAGDTTNGSNGGSSTFSTVTALGGGGGGKIATSGLGGASGGGSGSDSNLAAGGTGSQGYNGGTDGNFDGLYPAGGGGGSGGIGGNASTTSLGGHGGYGTDSSISGSVVNYAGGGGGGVYSTGGTGGTGYGGGGNGGVKLVPGVAGTANTGGGGGGGGQNGSGGNGGSGIVIIRYTTPSATFGANGKFGKSTSLSGTGNYLTSTINTSLSGSSFTISGWVNQTSAATQTWFRLGSSFGTNTVLHIRSYSDGTILCGFYSNDLSTSAGVFQSGGWHHVACTYNKDSNTRAIYYDGRKVASDTPSSAFTGNADLLLGNIAGVEDWNGNLDETRIYNRSLSQFEVSQLYSFAPGPIGYWKFDENAGTTANDISGLDNSATLTNSPLWSTGKFGSAISFSGNNQHVIRADDSDFDFGNGSSFTYGAWIKHQTASATEMIIDKYDTTTGNGGFKLYMESDGDLTCGIDDDETSFPEDSATSTLATYDDGNWHHVECVKSGTTGLYLYIDGTMVASDASISSTGDFANADPLYFGIAEDGISNDWIGQIDNIKIYNYARNSTQIIEDMNGEHSAPGSPVGSSVAKWKFDEGYGTTAHDNSINANDLTFSTASWTNDGKFGKAFNGLTNVRMSRSDDADLDFAASDDFSLSLWFKSDSATNPSANEYLMEKGGNIATDAIGYAIYTSAASDGLICFGIDDDSTSFPEDSVCSTSDLYDNTWHHIVAKKTGTTRLDLYADGKPTGTPDTSISATGTLENSATFYIGDTNGTDGTDEFLGDIDEVQVFRSALADDQVKALFNNASDVSMGALSTDSSNNPSNSDLNSYCPPGQGSSCTAPVAEWKLDENVGTTAQDSSGNANTGTITAGTGGYISGKLGSAYRFDGADTVVNTGSGSTLDAMSAITAEAWIYPKSEGENTNTWFINKASGGTTSPSSGWSLSFDSSGVNALRFAIDWNTDHVERIANDSTVTLNRWSHIAVSWDGSSTCTNIHIYINGTEPAYQSCNTPSGGSRVSDASSNLYFGSNYNTSRTLDGYMDDVKVYNYVRSPAQIAWDMNHGAPVGWWKLDENTGTSANDSTGNSTAGTLTNTPTWTTGKFNQAVSFAGSNQQILIADDPDFDFADDESMSITGWFKHSTASTQEIVLSKYAAAGYKVIMESDGDITCGLDYDSTWTPTDSATSTLATYDDGSWHHFACVKNGATSLSLYIDGNLITTDSSITATNTLTNSDPLYLGIDADGTSNDYTGSLDDIRIYRYPLTIQQIKTIMNNGSAVKY